MQDTQLIELYQKVQDATRRLEAKTAEILDMTQKLERLTKDTPAWYADTRARVEARAALEQAEELRHVLQE